VFLQHSSYTTETALLKVLSDILIAADEKDTLLALLDLSAAFDCVDHEILLSELQSKLLWPGWCRSCVDTILSV